MGAAGAGFGVHRQMCLEAANGHIDLCLTGNPATAPPIKNKPLLYLPHQTRGRIAQGKLAVLYVHPVQLSEPGRLADATLPRVCEVVQSFQIQGQQGLFAQMAIGRVDTKSPLKVTVVMQPNVSFPSDIKLGVDDKDTQPVVLTWLRCLPGGCFADADLKDDQLKRWKDQSGNGVLNFKDGAGKEIPLPFSFRGLPQALDALAKTT